MNEYNEYTVEEKKPILKTLKLILIVILIIALFVLLIWLIKGNNNENNNENESPLVNQIFYNNIERMKDAAESYFTLERLPQKEGDKITLTLEEMINKNLVLPLTDKNNNTALNVTGDDFAAIAAPIQQELIFTGAAQQSAIDISNELKFEFSLIVNFCVWHIKFLPPSTKPTSAYIH